MTPQDRAAEIAKQLYVGGQPPDIWVTMMEKMIVMHIAEAEKEAYEAGARWMRTEAAKVCHANCSWTSEKEVMALPVTCEGAIKSNEKP